MRRTSQKRNLLQRDVTTRTCFSQHWILLMTAFVVVVVVIINCCHAFQQPLHRFPSRRMTSASRHSTHLYYQPSNPENNHQFGDGGNSNQDDNSSNNRNEQDPIAFQKHMETVRSLQLSYYTTGTSYLDNPKQPVCTLEKSTGRLIQLPLWRASQWQLPGRSNVLEITDPIYTNMFESILYKPQPWCFGHLYIQEKDNEIDDDDDDDDIINSPITTRNGGVTSGEETLSTWQDYTRSGSSSSSTDSSSSSSSNKSAVLGCLMHIADYRRMSDGRLLLLVHVMERFVITDIVQQLPYSIVNAQILPDVEEIDPQLLDQLNDEWTEHDLQDVRAMAIQESVRYHNYEYDPYHSFSTSTATTSGHNVESTSTRRGIHSDGQLTDLQVEDNISLAAIAKVLPFCPFSKTMDPPGPTSSTPAIFDDEDDTQITRYTQSKNEIEKDQPALELCLLQTGVLKIPPSDPEFNVVGDKNDEGLSISELEYHLWIAINHFLVTTKLPVSPVLLSLLPPNPYRVDKDNTESTTPNNWPSDFYLYKIANDLNKLNQVHHDFVPVSKDYPAYRRQRRLSFSAAYLLEEYYKKQQQQQAKSEPSRITNKSEDLKALLLSIPSTKQRLRVVLERFLQWQQEEWGEFQ